MELIEDPNVPVIESDMRTTLQRQFENTAIKIDHNLYKADTPWPQQTNVWCFHCAHPFDTMPVPLVARYDHGRALAVCFGNFCSPNCGRAYAQDHRPISWSQAMVFYTKILSDCFGIPVETHGRAAWPKERLKVFGGDLSIEEFRAGFSTPLVMRVENVSFCMQNLTIVEVKGARDTSTSAGARDDSKKTDLEKGVTEIAGEDECERQRLNVLALQIINKSHSKGKCVADHGVEEPDLDQCDDENAESRLDGSEGSSRSDATTSESSSSVLATFLENLRLYKGDEKAARSAMVDAGAPVVRGSAVRAKVNAPLSSSDISSAQRDKSLDVKRKKSKITNGGKFAGDTTRKKN